ncbi:hypothetical protein QBC35DRAFT_452086 [Podospora australis]|uniref:Uncharacterized protein n=1 Tax=Podospora australis TaxID=1536484 RepID=A0AAN6WUS0_9PEZI|nr:hypothetical protein QBC35DRAFT_452086 [Podospora australis]
MCDSVFRELSRYSNTLRGYRFFRDKSMGLFKSSNPLGEIASKYALLDIATLELPTHSPDSDEARKTKAGLQALQGQIEELFLTAIRLTTSGITVQEKTSARKALGFRLGMALGGGIALVAPIVIMILHPAKLTAMLTTAFCVLGPCGDWAGAFYERFAW